MISKIIYCTIFLVALQGVLQELKLYDESAIAEVHCADPTNELRQEFGSGDYVEGFLNGDENDHKLSTITIMDTNEQILGLNGEQTDFDSQIDSNQGPPPFIPPPPDPSSIDSKGSFVDKTQTQEELPSTPLPTDRISFKGEKGERGERGEKGECFNIAETPTFWESSTTKSYNYEDNTQSCHCNISEIITQIKGPVGPPGLPGPPGPPGRGSTFDPDMSPGFFGSPGADSSFAYLARVGEPGMPGPRGLPGFKGEKGDTGFGVRGEKGDRGRRGKPGKPGQLGIPGPPGEVGSPGPPGPPGPAPDWSDNSISATRAYRGIKGRPTGRHSTDSHIVHIEGPPGIPGPPGQKGEPGSAQTSSSSSHLIVPGAVTFKDMETLLKMSTISPSGTLAFVLDEQALLVRVSGGWQYVALGTLVQTPSNIVLPETTSSAATAAPPLDIMLPEKSLRHHSHKKLRMAALNNPISGDLHGVRGADYECYRQSRRANMRGTFRAFVASRVQNLDSIVRFKDSKLPIVNIKGEVLFNSWRDLFTGAGAPFPFPPKIYSFDGRNVLTDVSWPQKLIWHGSDKLGVRDIDAYCDAWNSNSITKVGLASSLIRGKLLDQEKYSCNNAFIVLCIEATSPEELIGFSRQTRDIRDNHLFVDNNSDSNF